MARNRFQPPQEMSSLDISLASTTITPASGSSSSSGLPEKAPQPPFHDSIRSGSDIESTAQKGSDFERNPHAQAEADESKTVLRSRAPLKSKLKTWFSPGGNLRPFRLLKQDIRNIRTRYISDWSTFNQLVLASAVYVFFTNILPGITFASDLYVLTGKTWGTIEVVFSTGLCGLVFSLWVSRF
jgi:hypothetical protein